MLRYHSDPQADEGDAPARLGAFPEERAGSGRTARELADHQARGWLFRTSHIAPIHGVPFAPQSPLSGRECGKYANGYASGLR